MQVIEFVRALALAWKNLAAYPTGHPALRGTLDQVDKALRDLRGPAGEATFGIASDALYYGDLKIDVTAAQKFAHALFTRGVAVLRFSSETTTTDLEAFLRVLANTGPRSKNDMPLSDALTAAGIINVNAQAVHYSSVQVTDTVEKQENEQRPVWDDILRAILENRQFSAGVREVPRVASMDELSKLLSEYADEADSEMTFDPNATFGVRMASLDGTEHPAYRFLELTVGEAIANASGPRKQLSLEQALQLIRSLPYAMRKTIIRGVVRALGTAETASALLRQFASELPNDEVLDALRYLSSMTSLSQHAMSLLESLSTVEASSRAALPSPSVVSDLVKLFGEEDVNRFNPPDYRESLSVFALQIPQVPEEALTSMQKVEVRGNAVDETMPDFTNVLFDMLQDRSHKPVSALKRLENVFRGQLQHRNFKDALALVESLNQVEKDASPDHKRDFDDSIGRLAAGEAIHALIESVHKADPESAKLIHALARALGTNAQKSLLVALAQETSRLRRRRLLDFIATFGSRIVPDVIPMLQDERWYVVRNMIVLLRTVGDKRSITEIQPLARHPDLRVRMEAIKTLFALGSNVPSSLLDEMFNDPDGKVAETAVGLVGSYGIKEAVNPLLRLLEGNDMFGARRKIRIKAVRALGEIGDATALPHLERFLKTGFLPWPSRDERYAVWETLHRYPAEVRSAIVERGRRSADPQIRAICERLAGS